MRVTIHPDANGFFHIDPTRGGRYAIEISDDLAHQLLDLERKTVEVQHILDRVLREVCHAVNTGEGFQAMDGVEDKLRTLLGPSVEEITEWGREAMRMLVQRQSETEAALRAIKQWATQPWTSHDPYRVTPESCREGEEYAKECVLRILGGFYGG